MTAKKKAEAEEPVEPVVEETAPADFDDEPGDAAFSTQDIQADGPGAGGL